VHAVPKSALSPLRRLAEADDLPALHQQLEQRQQLVQQQQQQQQQLVQQHQTRAAAMTPTSPPASAATPTLLVTAGAATDFRASATPYSEGGRGSSAAGSVEEGEGQRYVSPVSDMSPQTLPGASQQPLPSESRADSAEAVPEPGSSDGDVIIPIAEPTRRERVATAARGSVSRWGGPGAGGSACGDDESAFQRLFSAVDSV
jgi:hypothetical protein